MYEYFTIKKEYIIQNLKNVLFFLISISFIYSNALHQKGSDHINQECRNPCDRTLQNYNKNSPSAAQFSFDRCDCRYTWCIQKTKDQQRRGRKIGKRTVKCSGSGKQNVQRCNNTLFCHKTSDQSSRNSPVSKSKRCKERCDRPCNSGQNAVFGIIDHPKLQIKRL